jgi:protocatechuate 3,4-dioxygenase beta subunit
MDSDDTPRGHVLPRRDILALLAAAGYTGVSGFRPPARLPAGPPDCVVRPAQTAGPYFVDGMLDRSDLRSDPTDGSVKPGVPLALTVVVSRLAGNACEPLPGAQVDLWHCDNRGIYSGVKDPAFDTEGRKFLRGFQVTDDQGRARFTTVYPGWYPGRAVHIHFKIRSRPPREPGFDFTSQFYFADALNDRVYADPRYAGQGGRNMRNAEDGIFRQGGDQLLLDLAAGAGGYVGTFHLALQGV